MINASTAGRTRRERANSQVGAMLAPAGARRRRGTAATESPGRSSSGPAAHAPDATAAHLAVVAAPIELDHATAALLLRWCEAWLHRLDVGEAHVAHLLIDVSHTRRAAPSGLGLLEHARTEAGRRGVGIHLIGAGALLAGSSLQLRRCLGRWSSFPHLDAARAALAEPRQQADRSAPVDPDAIVLTSLAPDRCR
jgi:anti-anti-sigma regulatory factor